jgi:hypothetical protein
MTQEEKSVTYDRLLKEHDRVSNQIASIKGESFELNEEQNSRINRLQNQLMVISNQMMTLMK